MKASLLLILVPLFLHFLLTGVVRRRPVLFTALAAGLSLLATLWIVGTSPIWPRAYRFAWLGVKAAPGKPLIIGGATETAFCGWPNQAPVPALTMTSDGSRLTARVAGGGAFIFARNEEPMAEWQPLNGSVLDPGAEVVLKEPVSRQQYALRAEPAGHAGWLRPEFRLFVRRATGQGWEPMAEALVHASRADGSVFGLGGALDARTTRMSGPVEAKVQFRQFAGTIRLFIPARAGEQLRILGPESDITAKVPLPCRLRARWANATSFEARITAPGGGLAVEFVRPWRWTSPLPDQIQVDGKKQYPRITFCAVPRPGDYAFTFPLGAFGRELREERVLAMVNDRLAIVDPRSIQSGQDLIPESAFKPEHVVGEPIAPAEIPAGDYYKLLTALVYDLPALWAMVAPALMALALFVLAMWLAESRMNIVTESRAAAFGLALVLWVFLCVRLLLAFRYGLESAHVDALSVDGVVSAYLALGGAPALLLLVVRVAFMNRGAPGKAAVRPWLEVLAFLAFLAAGLCFIRVIAAQLWPFWPGGGWAAAGALVAAVLLAGLLSALLGSDVARAPFCLGGLIEKFWRVLARSRSPLLIGLTIVGMLVVMGVFAASGFGLSYLPFFPEFAQEIWVPIGCIWLPVFFWLNAQGNLAALAPAPRRMIFWLTPATVVLTAASFGLQIYGSRDVGTGYAALAVLVALTLSLLVLLRAWRLGLSFLLALVLMFAVGWNLFTHHIELVRKYGGESAVRIQSYLDGSSLQLAYLFAEGIPAEAGGGGMQANKILNVDQHTWENKALAHEGAGWGMGFGQAPVRRSHVPLNTIQCDSVFSFYILSEHGYLGGLALLLAGFLPAAIVLSAGRPKFDVGCGLALIIALTFGFEMAAQAAMNLGCLPFTGRNLPLLTVLSATDLAKWTLLFMVAARALFLRFSPNGSPRPGALSLTESPSGFVRLPEPLLVGAFLLVLCAMVWSLGVACVRLVADRKLEKPFNWDDLNRQIEELADKGYMSVDVPTMTIKLIAHPPGFRELSIGDHQVFVQETVRFNTLPLEERTQDYEAQTARAAFGAANGVAGFDQMMDQFRQQALRPRVAARPTVFTLRFEPYPQDENELPILPADRSRMTQWHGRPGQWEIIANPVFSSHVDFHREATLPEIPRVWRGPAPAPLLLGPAWSMGRTVLAFDRELPVPWTRRIAEIMVEERRRLGVEAAAKRYQRLTLAPALQTSASAFVARKGRALYGVLLAEAARQQSTEQRELHERRPPRVALTVLDLAAPRSGEVLALAGWPRTSSSDLWETVGGEVLPPEEWVERAPLGELRSRLAGERNFDRMLMGSSTKPLLALAALGVHPFLARQLHTKGGDAEENTLFGMDFGNIRPWHASTAETWRGFNEYLAYSDNRYHVRLGFLALAKAEKETIARGPATSSEVEAIGTQPPTPWRAAPRFIDGIGFSAQNTSRLEALDKTPFAANLRDYFHIGVAHGDRLATRASFWTGEGGNDAPLKDEEKGGPGPVLRRWSPESVRLDLDRAPFIRGHAQPFLPRYYITVLLGGGTNMWPNVDFAGGFASAVTGRPVFPHLIASQEEVKAPAGTPFASLTPSLLPGLHSVLSVGTASKVFAPARQSNSLLARLEAMNVKVYAKTGTLEEDETHRKTSRLVLALVRWEKEEAKGAPVAGLVFSLVVEHTATGTATQWLGEFLEQNRPAILKALEER